MRTQHYFVGEDEPRKFQNPDINSGSSKKRGGVVDAEE